MDTLKNFALATVSTGYDASATSVVLTTGHGARFPTTAFYAVWWNSTDYANPADDPNVEIVRVTARSTDTLTVTRAQEGTSGSTKNTGGKTYKLMQAVTAALLAQIDLLSPLGAAEISITGATTATVGRMHVCSGTSADYTVTLPAASGNAGQFIGLRMASALTKLVTIDGNASELIDGATTRVMWAQESAILLCDGTGWAKIGGKTRAFFCRIHRAAAQSIAHATAVKILFDTIGSGGDPFGMADVVTDGDVTIARAGNYRYSTLVALPNMDAGETVIARFVVNGTDLHEDAAISAGTNQIVYASISDVASLAAGDVVTVNGAHFEGSSQDTLTQASVRPRFSIDEIPQW